MQEKINEVSTKVSHLEHDHSNLDRIVTDEFFKMFDNMGLCVTQKDDQVKELTKRVKYLEKDNENMQKQMRK